MTIRPAPTSPPDLHVTWTHDGMSVRQAGTSRFGWLVLALVFPSLAAAALQALWATWPMPTNDVWLGVLFVAAFPIMISMWVPRRVEVRGDWLILVGVGQSRIRLDSIEGIRLAGRGKIVFDLVGGGRRRIWLEQAFMEAGRQWLFLKLHEAMAQARAKAATRQPADEGSKRAMAALRRDAVREQ